MRRLGEPVKRRIVEHLACYRSHGEIVELIAEEFNIVLPPRHVRAYDPTSFQFAGRHEWMEYHSTVRRRFEEHVGEVAIAQRAYRLRSLQHAHDKVHKEVMGADPHDLVDLSKELRGILEQAAKEVGGVFTNVSRTVRANSFATTPVTIEEKRNILAERIFSAMQKALPRPDTD